MRSALQINMQILQVKNKRRDFLKITGLSVLGIASTKNIFSNTPDEMVNADENDIHTSSCFAKPYFLFIYSHKQVWLAFNKKSADFIGRFLVGMTGFEPAASSSRTKRATGLRYIPKNFKQI